jgi:hypothetical protein
MDVTEGYGEELGISKQNEEVKSAPLAKRANHVFETIASLSSRKRVRAKGVLCRRLKRCIFNCKEK